MPRIRFGSVASLMATAGLLLFATAAAAAITSIVAHGTNYSAGDTIPVFVDASGRNSIVVKGQYMDLATAVESSDSSFTVTTGQRTGGSNTSLEVLVAAGSAPDQDISTIRIKFVSGEETFKIKAFKTSISAMDLLPKTAPTCHVGEFILLGVYGPGMANLVIGAAGAMLDVANARYDIQSKRAESTATSAKFSVKCTAEGQFTIDRTWFSDSRVSNPNSAHAMVRGSTALTVTVTPVPTPAKVKQSDVKPVQEPQMKPLAPLKK